MGEFVAFAVGWQMILDVIPIATWSFRRLEHSSVTKIGAFFFSKYWMWAPSARQSAARWTRSPVMPSPTSPWTTWAPSRPNRCSPRIRTFWPSESDCCVHLPWASVSVAPVSLSFLPQVFSVVRLECHSNLCGMGCAAWAVRHGLCFVQKIYRNDMFDGQECPLWTDRPSSSFVLLTNSFFTAKLSNTLNAVNVVVVLFCIAFGFATADVANWTYAGFLPYGFAGVLRGAASSFTSYIGFEGIASAGKKKTFCTSFSTGLKFFFRQKILFRPTSYCNTIIHA